MSSTAVMSSSETIIMKQQSEVITSSTTTVKKSHSLHRKKSKKEEKNISVKSSSEKVKKKMKTSEGALLEANPNCQACGKAVYAMERIKAEKLSWHKECFRCKECNKPLSVETFQSHSSNVYCKPHFKQLFAPKAVEEDEQEKRKIRKPQMIICESNPKELPPDVVRASDKPDLGLEELASLDVKSRFQVFENGPQEPEPKPLEHPLARDKSSTLLSKLAKFKSKGMDIGVADKYLNGIPIEASSSEAEDEDDEDAALRKSIKHTSQREQPVSFCNMSEILGKFESGEVQATKNNSERKQEIQSIRSRLFMGKQAKIKEMYQQSVAQSEQSMTSAEKIARELQLEGEKASSIKEKFENGDIFREEEHQKKEIVDENIFNAGISKQSRSIFKEIDENIMNSGSLQTPPKVNEPKRKEKPFVPKDVVRSTDQVDDVKIETSDISNKFKFFETYKPKEEKKQFRMTPPRETDKRESPEQELYRDPAVVRSDDDTLASGTNIAQQRHTASRMINVFKQMEQEKNKEDRQGPKPLKCFTPPPPGADYHAPSSSEEEYGSEEEEDSEEYSEEEYEENVKRYSHEDEALKQAQAVARAKSLRSRFENWADNDAKVSQSASVIFEQSNGDDQSQIESAKSIRKKFETMGTTTNNVVKTFSTPKVNRFV